MENQQDQNQFRGADYQPSKDYYSELSKEPIPNSTGILVLGISSIVMSFCTGLLGVILGIIALALLPAANRAYEAEPDRYTRKSKENLKGGKITAIIGLCLGAIYIVITLFSLIFMGFFMAEFPWDQIQ